MLEQITDAALAIALSIVALWLLYKLVVITSEGGDE